MSNTAPATATTSLTRADVTCHFEEAASKLPYEFSLTIANLLNQAAITPEGEACRLLHNEARCRAVAFAGLRPQLADRLHEQLIYTGALSHGGDMKPGCDFIVDLINIASGASTQGCYAQQLSEHREKLTFKTF